MDNSKSNIHIILVLACIAIGCLLRFWAPSELAFINDELSTWAKLDFESVFGVIHNIKVDDSHPVGMYVFLYYWTGLFGKSQLAIKLPSAIMAILCMPLLYDITRKWFNPTVSLFVLAYFATLQFPIWWAAIARQYQYGLFTTLLMVWFWTSLLVEQKNDQKYWLGLVLAGVGAMYSHYFSLIVAAMIGGVGILFTTKENRIKYLGTGVAMVLCFLPHIPVTLYQLSHADGHTWYPIPEPNFILVHLQYIFHYSSICLSLMGILFCFSLISGKAQSEKSTLKFHLTSLFFFLFPLLFGYFYSVYRSPILRESHLLFSFPYLIVFLLSFFGNNLSNAIKTVITIAIIGINTWSLVSVRQHYVTMNTHPYQPFIAETKAFLAAHKKEDTHIVLGENPLYLQYYKKWLDANFEHYESFRPKLPYAAFRRLLRTQPKPYLVIGALPDYYRYTAMDQYPYLIKKREGINFEYYILSKNKNDGDKIVYDYKSTLDFNDEQVRKEWKYPLDKVALDTPSINFYYPLHAGEEWSVVFQDSASKLAPQKSTWINVAIDVRTDSVQPTGQLVLELIDSNGTNIAWLGQNIAEQTTPSRDWQSVYLSMRLVHYIKDYDLVKNATFKVYFWNREKQALAIDRFRITAQKGNHILYKDTNPFD